MVLLPTIRGAYLKSFALTLGLGSAVIGCALAYWAGQVRLMILIAVIAALFSIAGIAQPAIMTRPYRQWNNAARYFARGGRLILMGICFYVIFFAVGRAGSAMKLARPLSSLSLWTSKRTNPLAAFLYEFSPTDSHLHQTDWLGSYLYWCKSSGQFWAICLVPFLAMLAAVEIYTDRRFPVGVYTLF
jgi:hypothetical protein